MRIHHEDLEASFKISKELEKFLKDKKEIIYLCIGTDRSTGDSLGPMVGMFLEKHGVENVYGTLFEPVHAENLRAVLEEIRIKSPNAFVVAIDACLGDFSSIGIITVDKGSIRPGAGVKRNLPAVGDCHITGVVNVGGFMEYQVLQNTRLSLVYKIAEKIAIGIVAAHGVSLAAAAKE